MMRGFRICLLFCAALTSCQGLYSNGDSDKVIARVYDKCLYQSDLKAVVYDGIGRNDSIAKAHSFIETWIRNQLVIHQAETNLSKEQLDFSYQIDEYRNSLIMYRYESELIEQNMDTMVSEKEISDYIEANRTLEMDEGAARRVILNIRRKQFVEDMRENLYNKAVKDCVFEIY